MRSQDVIKNLILNITQSVMYYSKNPDVMFEKLEILISNKCNIYSIYNS